MSRTVDDAGVLLVARAGGACRMRLLHYLEIRNFKCFGDTQRIELDHPAVRMVSVKLDLLRDLFAAARPEEET